MHGSRWIASNRSLMMSRSQLPGRSMAACMMGAQSQWEGTSFMNASLIKGQGAEECRINRDGVGSLGCTMEWSSAFPFQALGEVGSCLDSVVVV